MSNARRTAVALGVAHEQVIAAHSAAVRYRNRGRSSWRAQVAGLAGLVLGMESTAYLVRELAGVAKACADDARAHYCHDTDPDAHEWPETVVAAAQDADQALSRLRSDLEKVRVVDAHNALAVLHAAVQNAHRAATRRTTS